MSLHHWLLSIALVGYLNWFAISHDFLVADLLGCGSTVVMLAARVFAHCASPARRPLARRVCIVMFVTFQATFGILQLQPASAERFIQAQWSLVEWFCNAAFTIISPFLLATLALTFPLSRVTLALAIQPINLIGCTYSNFVVHVPTLEPNILNKLHWVLLSALISSTALSTVAFFVIDAMGRELFASGQEKRELANAKMTCP